MNIRKLIEKRCYDLSSQTFMYFKDQEITYQDLESRVNSLANGFAKGVGVKKGDKVCLMLPNCPEFIFSWFALSKLGAVMVPINVSLKGEGLKYILNHSDAKVLILDEGYEANLSPIRKDLGIEKYIYKTPQDKGQLTTISDFYDSPTTSPPEVDLQDQDLMAILYTSGTTGMPKGVMLSHKCYINTGTEFVEKTLKINSDDVLYTFLPLFHINAQQTTVMGALVSGNPMVLSPGFSASSFLDEVRYYKATVFNYLGAILTMIFKQPERPDDGDNPLRIALGGAAPKELWEAFEKRFRLKILEGYGLTETSTYCLVTPLDRTRVGSIGKPNSFSDVQVVDENDCMASPGVQGEIVARPRYPHVFMEGYYKDELATSETMRGGWLHTGDRGYMDEEGYFYFVDRLKDCIRRRGENISSFEVENIILSHPSVLECAAIPVPAEMGEDEVKVVVVLRPGMELNPEDLLGFCQERMAYFMVPRYVEFMDDLPKTETQRVKKYQLREEGIGKAWDREKSSFKVRR